MILFPSAVCVQNSIQCLATFNRACMASLCTFISASKQVITCEFQTPINHDNRIMKTI